MKSKILLICPECDKVQRIKLDTIFQPIVKNKIKSHFNIKLNSNNAQLICKKN